MSLLLLTLIYVGFMVAGGSRLSAAHRIPLDSAEKAVAYIAKNGWSIQLGSFFELSSAIPLGIFVAATVGRLRFIGVRAAGELVAFLGGIGAVITLILAALADWSLTRPGTAEVSGAVRALQALSFASAGPGFAVLLGLFIAGVSITAGRHKIMPPWLMWLGLGITLACELAGLTVLNFTAGYFIPVGRFVSIVWMIGVSLTLPVTIASSIHDSETSPAA